MAPSERKNHKNLPVASFTPTSVAGLQQDLHDLAEHSHAIHELLSASLRRLATHFRSPYVALAVQLDAGAHEDHWHRGETDPAFWKKTVDAHLTEVFSKGKSSCRLLGPATQSERMGILGAPLRKGNGGCVGAITVVLSKCDVASARQQLVTLESLVGFLSLCMEKVQDRRERPDTQTELSADSSSVLRTRKKPMQIAYALTNQLRNKLGCDQVALGVPIRKRIKILSVSGMDDVHPRSPGIRLMRSAMEECYDCQETILCPGADAWAKSGSVGYRLHWQWSQAVGGDSIASFALTDDKECVAIISLRRKADRPLTLEEVEQTRKSIGHLGPALRLSQLAGRNVWTHAMDSVRYGWTQFSTGSNRKWQGVAVAMAILLAWMVFGRVEYHLLVSSTLRARSAQVLTAPFDGVLLSQNAVAGDAVKAEQVLCRLDDSELRLKQRELESRIRRIEKQKDEAFANGERAKVQILAAQQDEVTAELGLVRWRLERATIVVPFDAVILEGDLRKRVGSPVKAGQSLFEVAPPGQVFVELGIPEEEIDEVRIGMEGGFASNAMPEKRHRFEISSIHPMAVVRDRHTVYTCEATLSETAPWFRPGMEGMARVSVGRRPVWWVALHRLIDYVRMKAWL